MSVRELVKAGVRAASPVLARWYRANPAAAPHWLLTSLEIANVRHRPAFYTLARLVESLEQFAGDVIECGVYKGATLLGMAHALAQRGLRHVPIYGLDSFAGFPEPSPEDALGNGSFHPLARKGVFADTSHESVLRRVRACGYGDQIRLLKGFFADTLPALQDRRFSIAHIDCDLYQPYKECLEFIYPRTVAGGYLVFDEYDFSAPVYPGAQKAIDEFFADKPEQVTRFPDCEVPRFFVQKTAPA